MLGKKTRRDLDKPPSILYPNLSPTTPEAGQKPAPSFFHYYILGLARSGLSHKEKKRDNFYAQPHRKVNPRKA